jgi:Kef-type K+ transport system membrane component KefB
MMDAIASLVPRAGGPSSQAGVIEGANPVEYSTSSPINLFIVQAIIVIVLCQLLTYPLRLLHQPRVIAEVIGGIILGPSVMMRIPGFQENIFPTESMPVFNNVATLGLIVFLFLVALELDVRLFAKNIKAAVLVGFAGMALPFGLGVGLAWGVYHQFPRTSDGNDDGTESTINFGVFALFVGTALAITAFPVLCRILTELNLLHSNVGVTVLAAGIGNDVVGWVLLALCVALVNNTSGLAALYVLLCAIGWTLFLVFLVRPAFVWCLRKTGSLQNGPTQGMVALTIILVLLSSWFTAIVGVHAIFGAFLVGLICPHDGGFAIKLTEKIEDFISVIFLPLYFALSGLNTNLGLLDDGITWAYVVAIIMTAFFGKVIGATLAARTCKLLWRESVTIGALMSCKGLVELIVLNIGLQANILSQKTFTMFVVMALVTTVATTPLAKLFYPVWYQKKVEAWRNGEIDWDGNPTGDAVAAEAVEKLISFKTRRLLVYLRLDSLPGLFTFISLLGNDKESVKDSAKHATVGEKNETTSSEPEQNDLARLATTSANAGIPKRPLEVHGVRLLELSDRTSSVMRLTEADDVYQQRDPVLNAFRTFSLLNDVAVAGRVAVVPTDSYADTLLSHASDISSDLVLIPWSDRGSLTEDHSVPLDESTTDRFSPSSQLSFIQKAFQVSAATCTTAILIDNGLGGSGGGSNASNTVERPQTKRNVSTISAMSTHELPLLPITNKSHQIFFPFFGGIDDRVALHFVLQLARNPNVFLTVANLTSSGGHDSDADNDCGPSSSATAAAAPTSSKAVEEVTAQDLALISTLQASVPHGMEGRVTVVDTPAATASDHDPISHAVTKAREVVGRVRNAGDIIVLGRRHTRLGDPAAVDIGSSSSSSSPNPNATELRRTVGAVGDQVALAGLKASVLVIQAGGRALEL